MSLRFCLKCREIVDDRDALLYSSRYYCKTCEKPLVYFGREEAEVSEGARSQGEDVESPSAQWTDLAPVIEGHALPGVAELEAMDILRSDPGNARALYHLAMLAKGRSDFLKAISYLNQVIEIDRDVHEPYRELADIYFYLQDFEQAVVSLLKLEQLFPGDEDVVFNLGVAYMLLELFDKARVYFEKAKGLTSSSERFSQLTRILGQF